MYCISCKPIVEKQLKHKKGVKSIKFDYLTDKIIVEFDPSVLTTEDIKNSLNKSGYKFVRLANRRFYNITVVEGNIFHLPAGTFKSHADGFFVFLEPPPPGKHDLTLRTSVVNPTTPSYNYAAESIYHLTIK